MALPSCSGRLELHGPVKNRLACTYPNSQLSLHAVMPSARAGEGKSWRHLPIFQSQDLRQTAFLSALWMPQWQVKASAENVHGNQIVDGADNSHPRKRRQNNIFTASWILFPPTTAITRKVWASAELGLSGVLSSLRSDSASHAQSCCLIWGWTSTELGFPRGARCYCSQIRLSRRAPLSAVQPWVS